MVHSLFLILTSFSLAGQDTTKTNIFDMPIPADLQASIRILDKTLPEEHRALIKDLPPDSIIFHEPFITGTKFFYLWKICDSSKLTGFFNKQGLQDCKHIYKVILVSYHRHLNDKPIKFEQQIQKLKAHPPDLSNTNLIVDRKDSVHDTYIPENPEDCFFTLTKVLSKANIDTIRALPSSSKTLKYHMTLGRWIRNNFGLWGNSRLAKYFLNRGVNHPDHMSGEIMKYYYEWTYNNHENWKQFHQKGSKKQDE